MIELTYFKLAVSLFDRDDWVIAGFKLEESPDSMERRCWITSSEGNLRESATENIPPRLALVRVKRRGKSSPGL